MSFQQGQTPPQQQGGQRTGFSALPQTIQQAITGVFGVGVLFAAILGLAAFMSSTTGKVALFETIKLVSIVSTFVCVIIYLFMWIRVSMSATPSVIEMAIPIVGLGVAFGAIALSMWVVTYTVSYSAAVINMTLN